MRIGFDAKRAFMNASGLGNYSRSLMSSMLNRYPGEEYFAFTPRPPAVLGTDLTASGRLHTVTPGTQSGWLQSALWRTFGQVDQIHALQLDLYHGLSNELPRRMPSGVKKVVTIHDLIFLRHPAWYPLIDRNIYFHKFRHACKNADAVVAVSQHSKADISYYFNIPDEKLHVVYQSCDSRFTPEKDTAKLELFRSQMGLPDNYLLYVGTIEERKNLMAILKAMTQVSNYQLVVIGRRTKYFSKVWEYIESNQLQSRVLFPQHVTGEALPSYFQGAAAFIYPSMYEGFGIPVIEALSCGTPVITSRNSALPEAAGPDSVYVDPGNSTELSAAIAKVLEDSSLRERMRSGGLKHVRQFHPDRTAGQLMQLYKTLTGK